VGPTGQGEEKPRLPSHGLLCLLRLGVAQIQLQHQHHKQAGSRAMAARRRDSAPSPSCQKLKLRHWFQAFRAGLNRCRPARRYASVLTTNATHNSGQAQNDSGCRERHREGEGGRAGGGSRITKDQCRRQPERHWCSRPCSWHPPPELVIQEDVFWPIGEQDDQHPEAAARRSRR